MEKAKLFENGGSQAVRLPKKYRFSSREVLLWRLGRAVVLMPAEERWAAFLEGLEGFSQDFLEGGRENPPATAREEL